MARSAREIFLARGYTEAEIAVMPILQDARFTSALEAEDVERERIAADLKNTTDWYHGKAKPAMTKLAEDAVNARAESARIRAEMEARREYGLSQVAQNQNGGQGGQSQPPAQNQPPANAPQNFDPSRYVDQDTFNGFGTQMGNAIAMAQDIATNYRALYGHDIPGGLKGLRADYARALENHTISGSLDLEGFAEQKYNMPAKRAEITAAARAKEISDAVAAERVKWASEQGNPMTRTPISSRSPFAGRKAQGGSVDGHQPWEKTDAQRSSERIFKVVQKQAERGVA